MSRVLWLFALVGCQEYGLDGKPPVATGSTSSSTPTTGDSSHCGTDPLPGFDGEFNDDCSVEPSLGTFTPVIKWDSETFPGPYGDSVMSAPIVVETNDDNHDGKIDTNDTPDVVFVSYGSEGILRALDGATGTQLWAVSGYGLQPQGGVAGADIDGDGKIELVSLTYNGAAAFENTGKLKWQVSNLSGHIYGTSDVPAISDMDHDGKPEIIAGSAILNAKDGSLRGAGNLGIGGVNGANVGSCSFAVDLDGDGMEEVVTGNAAYNIDGSVKYSNGFQDGYPAVADLDLDGKPEIVASGQGELRIMNYDLTPRVKVAIPGSGSIYYGGPPTIADFDGDGLPEIGVAAGSEYSVFEADGTIDWQETTDDSSSGNTGSAVFDFEGDGAAEAVYADQTRLWVYNGADGSVKLESTEHSNGTWLEYPVIADVDGDGHVEIVVANTPYNLSKTGITVFADADDSWQPGRKIWNQYAYFITNINDDGTVPKKAKANWKDHNNFRSGDLGSPDGFSAPDLREHADVCDAQCDADGTLVVYVYPGNEGASDVKHADDPEIKLYAELKSGKEKLLDTKKVHTDLLTGSYQESVVFVIKGEDPTKWDSLKATISSSAPECKPSNNDLVIKGPFCQ